MKITDNRGDTFVSFGSLNNGDVFEYENALHMKLPLNGGINAVRLCDAILYCFASNHQVIPVNCELVIS